MEISYEKQVSLYCSPGKSAHTLAVTAPASPPKVKLMPIVPQTRSPCFSEADVTASATSPAERQSSNVQEISISVAMSPSHLHSAAMPKLCVIPIAVSRMGHNSNPSPPPPKSCPSHKLLNQSCQALGLDQSVLDVVPFNQSCVHPGSSMSSISGNWSFLLSLVVLPRRRWFPVDDADERHATADSHSRRKTIEFIAWEFAIFCGSLC
mmetsp:Transcript_28440/g.47271  ORF Transcript_28440/g.47271 Transcript_28440/m.47271 type:complete len:208 (+) Transcript_28440:1116-1739(+)